MQKKAITRQDSIANKQLVAASMLPPKPLDAAPDAQLLRPRPMDRGQRSGGGLQRLGYPEYQDWRQ